MLPLVVLMMLDRREAHSLEQVTVAVEVFRVLTAPTTRLALGMWIPRFPTPLSAKLAGPFRCLQIPGATNTS